LPVPYVYVFGNLPLGVVPVVAARALVGVLAVPVTAVVPELDRLLLARACVCMARACVLCVPPPAPELLVRLAEAFAWADGVA